MQMKPKVNNAIYYNTGKAIYTIYNTKNCQHKCVTYLDQPRTR